MNAITQVATRRPVLRNAALLLLSSLLLAACGGSGGGGDDPGTVVEPQGTVIGPQGGTVSGSDGALVIVPAGALASTVEIKIEKDATGAPAVPGILRPIGSIFALTPHGTTFSVPVTIRIPFDTTLVPANATPRLYKAELGGSFEEIPATVDAGFLVAQVSNFSFPLPALGDIIFSQLSGTCGRASLSGKIYCWGEKGQLSASSSTSYVWLVPTKVSERMFGSFAAGHATICGISNGIEVWCVGENYYGSLGDGTMTEFQATPVKAAAPNGIGVLVAGSDTGGINDGFFCGIVQDGDTSNPENGKVYCWGNNFFGQLGIGSAGSNAWKNVPTQVAGLGRYVAISAGRGFVCAIQITPTVGAVDCWGENNDAQTGQPGGSTNGFVYWVPTPKTVPSVTLTVANNSIAAGGKHACGLRTDNTAICWGGNVNGQIGDGTRNIATPYYKAPTPVTMPNGVTFNRLYAGGDNTCGLTTAGDAYCWGDNYYGQIGIGATGGQQLTPATKVSGGPFKTLSVTNYGTVCGIGQDSITYCWGRAGKGQLGNGSAIDAPPVATPTPVTAPRS